MRIPLPRDQWVEICDPDEITGEQKRVYQTVLDRLLYPNGSDQAQAPDPDNPAVMIVTAPPRARLTTENVQQLRDIAHGACITAWSYEMPLPYTAESLKTLPAVADDAIEEAMAPHYEDVFNSFGPKADRTTVTSASTSPDDAPSLPLESVSAPSGGVPG